MPTDSNARRRRTWQRDVLGAVEFAVKGAQVNGDHLKGVERVLARMEKWLDDPAQDDPRVDWEAWVKPRKTTSKVAGLAGLSPLMALLEHDTLPVAVKQRVIAITRRLENGCPEWLDEADEQRYYGGLSLQTWLRCADLPQAVAFFHERQDPAFFRAQGLERNPDWTPPGETEWGASFARLLMNPVTHRPQRNDLRNLSGSRQSALLDAAIRNRWLPADFLGRHTWSDHHLAARAANALVPASLNDQHNGQLVEILATIDLPGGLFDRWRRERDDWSTWVSPTSESTVWRSLLVNHDPRLLLGALRDDPSALDRPVPVGRWIRGMPRPHDSTMNHINGVVRPPVNIPGIAPESVRYHAGVALGTYHLDLAMKAFPDDAPRMLAWWDDQAPRLRETIDVVARHLLPAATTGRFGQNNDWAVQVGNVAEGLLLREVLGVADTAHPHPSPSSVRSRTRL